MKRTLASLLALLMFATLAACSSGGDGAETTAPSGGAADVTTAAETDDGRDSDDLPELDYKAAEFAVFTRDRDGLHNVLNYEEITGDMLNDALYERDRFVEERLNVVLTETLNSDTGVAKTAIEAGDDTIKLVHCRCVYTVEYASSGLGYMWDKVKYIDLDKNYWYDSINDNLTMKNIVFTGAGAYNLTSFDYTHVILFNKDMAKSLNIENLYDVVRGGKWTWDKFMEVGKKAIRDVNGDGVMDDKDNYGIATAMKQVPPCFLEGAGYSFLAKDPKTDTPVFSLDKDEKFISAYTKLYEMFWDSGIWYQTTATSDIPPACITLFQQDQTLMMESKFYTVQEFREMDANFGVIPFPKYNEAQAEYYSRIEGCELPLIPSSLKQEDADMAGAFLEAMSSYSHENVVEVYYELYLKSKLTRDSESAEMFDLIFANRIFDLGDTVWCPDIRDGFIRTLISENNRAIVSTIQENVPKVNEALTKIMTGFDKLGK